MKSVANIPRPATVTATKKLQETISCRIHMIEPRCLVKYRSVSHFARNRCEQVHIAALNFAPWKAALQAIRLKLVRARWPNPHRLIAGRSYQSSHDHAVAGQLSHRAFRPASRYCFTSPGVPAGSFSGHSSRLGNAKGNRSVRPGGSLGAVTARAISRWQGPCRRHLGTGRRYGRRADLCRAGSG